MKATVAALALAGLAVLAGPAYADQLSVNLASPGLVPIEVSDAGATVGGDRAVVGGRRGRALRQAGADASRYAAPLDVAARRLRRQRRVGRAQRDARGQARVAVGCGRSRAGPLPGTLVLAGGERGSTSTALLRGSAPAPDGARSPMEQWHHVELPAGVDASAVAAELLALPGVSFAYPAADAAPPPQTAPPRRSRRCRAILRPAPVGTDNDFALQDPRTRGAGVRIADLEYYWTAEHEDLQLDPVAADLGGAAYPQYRNFADEHGTAVFGEMVGKDNGFGVTGGVPDASMHGISPTRARATGSPQYIPSAALVYVAQFLSPGDVVLLEQQTVGPNGGTALRAARVEPSQLRRDQAALRPRHRRRRDRRQRQRGSRLGTDAGPLRPRGAQLRRDRRRCRRLRHPHRPELLLARHARRPPGLGQQHHHHGRQRQPAGRHRGRKRPAPLHAHLRRDEWAPARSSPTPSSPSSPT